MNALILSLVIQFASYHNIDPQLAMAIIKHESKFDVNARGKAGEIGLMQVMPENAKHLPKKKLFDPGINIAIGMALLAEAKDKCPHQKDNTWIVCYNLGLPRAKKVKHPTLWPYYKDVMKEYHQ